MVAKAVRARGDAAAWIDLRAMLAKSDLDLVGADSPLNHCRTQSMKHQDGAAQEMNRIASGVVDGDEVVDDAVHQSVWGCPAILGVVLVDNYFILLEWVGCRPFPAPRPCCVLVIVLAVFLSILLSALPCKHGCSG